MYIFTHAKEGSAIQLTPKGLQHFRRVYGRGYNVSVFVCHVGKGGYNVFVNLPILKEGASAMHLTAWGMCGMFVMCVKGAAVHLYIYPSKGWQGYAPHGVGLAAHLSCAQAYQLTQPCRWLAGGE